MDGYTNLTNYKYNALLLDRFLFFSITSDRSRKMEKLMDFDGFLIDRLFQPIALKVQEFFGFDNFWLAKVCVIIHMCFIESNFFKALSFFLGLAIVFLVENELTSRKTMSISRHLFFPYRIISLLGLIVSGEDFFRSLSFVAIYYFLECKLPPSSESKIKKFFKNLLPDNRVYNS